MWPIVATITTNCLNICHNGDFSTQAWCPLPWSPRTGECSLSLFLLSLTYFSLMIFLTILHFRWPSRIFCLFTFFLTTFQFSHSLNYFSLKVFIAIVSLSFSLDVFTLTFESCLFLLFFTPADHLHFHTPTLNFSPLRVFQSLLAWWYNCSGWTSLFSDAFPSSLSTLFPYITTQVHIISPLRYI